MTFVLVDHTGREHPFHDLPEASQKKFAVAGFGHMINNEVDSGITARVKRQIAGEGGKASGVPKEAVAPFRDANPDLIDTWRKEIRDSKIVQMLEGTLGVSQGGGGAPAVDPQTKEEFRIARGEMAGVFKARKWNNGKLPAAGELFRINQIELDGPGWVNRWLCESNDKQIGGPGNPNKPRIEKLARRNLAEKAKAAQGAVSAAATDEAEGL